MHLLILFLLHLFQADPPIVASRDTTYITEPLRPNGLPDYEKYVLEMDRKGATPENNAAVLLFQALWPCMLDPEDYKMVSAELGLKEIPSAKAALEPLYGDANKKRVADWRLKQHLSVGDSDLDTIDPAIEQRWTSRQFPPLAEWVDANKRPLDLIVEASRRPRFYSPSPTLLEHLHDVLIAILLPGPQSMRQAAWSLAVRAMRHVGENRLNDAWTDLLAIHRLARLVAQGDSLVEQLIATSVSYDACRGTLVLLSHDDLTIELARRIKKDLDSLQNVSHMADCVNGLERLTALEAALGVKQYGLAGITGESHYGPDFSKYMAVDWNVALRKVNEWYDRHVAILRIADREARSKAYAKFDADLTAECERARQPSRMIAAFFSLRVRGELIGALTANLMMQNVPTEIDAEDRAITTLQLTRLAAALAVYRAEHRSYPVKLGDLVPGVIEKLPLDVYAKPFIYNRTDDGYLLYSTGDNGVDDGGSNKTSLVLAGRSWKEINNFDSRQPDPEIPDGADDIAIRVPPPPFKLPKASQSAVQP